MDIMGRGLVIDDGGYIQFIFNEDDGLDGDPVVKTVCESWVPSSIKERHENFCKECKRVRSKQYKNERMKSFRSKSLKNLINWYTRINF